MNDITSKIEKLREKLHSNIDKYGLDSRQVRKTSDELDKLINEYYSTKKYPEDSDMYQAYLESINELKKITSDFNKYPTTKEWGKYAKEKGLLNVVALEYISGLNWNKLRDKIGKKKS